MFETQLQEQQDQEITLGTGRLLGLFFALVVICALFFSLGFSFGRKSAMAAGVAGVLPIPVANGGGPKPTSTKAGAKPDCAAGQDCPQASTSDELTFYKAVEQNEAKAQLDKPADNNAATASKPAEQKAPEMEAPAPSSNGYMVQIAAVSKQEDAEALVNALKRKSYPVFTASLPSDKLFHVQVGPFADIKDAEAVRAKLVSDGYNPILKR